MPGPGVGAVGITLTGTARPICPTCGAPLFARDHGVLTCVSHGHWLPADLLDATLGNGMSAYVIQLVGRAPLTPRKCPDDRYEMSYLRNPSGSVESDACGRCGGVWIPLASVEHARAAGAQGTREVLALACARSLAAPAHPVRR